MQQIATGTHVRPTQAGLELLRATQHGGVDWEESIVLEVVRSQKCNGCGTILGKTHPENCTSRFYTLAVIGAPHITVQLADTSFYVTEPMEQFCE